MSINLTHQAMTKAVTDVEGAAEHLARARREADREVTSLVGGSWTGAAADAFGDAWSQWNQAADRVKLGLDSMSQLLTAVHHDFIRQDDESQRHLDSIAQRVVDRLG